LPYRSKRTGKTNPFFLGIPTPVLGMKEGEREGGRNLLIFKDKPLNDYINEKVSSRAIH